VVSGQLSVVSQKLTDDRLQEADRGLQPAAQ